MIFGRSKQERKGTMEELRLLLILAEQNKIPVSRIKLSESAYNDVYKFIHREGDNDYLFGNLVEFEPDIQLLTELD